MITCLFLAVLQPLELALELVRAALLRLLRAAAGCARVEDVLAELDEEPDDLQYAMTAYGLYVLQESGGKTEKAAALQEKLLARSGFWFCFSFLAAYHDASDPE